MVQGYTKKIISVIHYQENVNQNHSEILHHTYKTVILRKTKQNKANKTQNNKCWSDR